MRSLWAGTLLPHATVRRGLGPPAAPGSLSEFRLVLNVSEDALAITQSGPYRAVNPQETQVRIIHPKAHEQNK